MSEIKTPVRKFKRICDQLNKLPSKDTESFRGGVFVYDSYGSQCDELDIDDLKALAGAFNASPSQALEAENVKLKKAVAAANKGSQTNAHVNQLLGDDIVKLHQEKQALEQRLAVVTDALGMIGLDKGDDWDNGWGYAESKRDIATEALAESDRIAQTEVKYERK